MFASATFGRPLHRRRRLILVAAVAALCALVATGMVAVGPDPAEAAAPEIVVDNTDHSPAFTTTGTWSSSKGLPNYYGTDYLYAGSPSATARWTPTVTDAGDYGVYYWIPNGNSSRASNAPFTVHDAIGDFTYAVNEQATAGGRWVFLGNHTFSAGTAGYVELANAANGVVIADAVMLGATQQEPISQQIKKAVAYGESSVTIVPGEYRMSAGLSLSGLPDGFTINATGVDIVNTSRTQALGINANGLTLTGLTIDYDPLPFTQGRVVEVADDGSSVNVQISAGYSRPSPLYNRVTLFDPDQRLPYGQTIDAQVSWLDQAAGLAQAPGSARARVGDIVTFAGGSSGGPAFGATVMGSDVTLRDVTMHTAPGMGLINTSGDGGMHLDGFHLEPGSPPPGGTEPPILSSTWDGLQVQGVKRGPTIENSTVVNAGDDSMSITGIGNLTALKVGTAADGTPSVWMTTESIQVGDRLQQFIDGPTPVVISKVVETDPAIIAEVGSDSTLYRLGIDRDVPWTDGTPVTDIDRMGNGFVFRNNRIDSSGRSFLVKARDGVIADNDMRGGLTVAPEVWAASNASTGGRLQITGNTFRSPLWGGGYNWNNCQMGTVSFEGGNSAGRSFYDVVISGNSFVDIRGLNLNLQAMSRATITDNAFIGSQQLPYTTGTNKCGNPSTAVVSLNNSDDVVFSGNTIDHIGPRSVQQVVVAANALDVTGLPDGVRVASTSVAVDPVRRYTLANRNSALLLGVGAGSKVGSGASQQDAAKAPAQGWRFAPRGDGAVQIINAGTGLALTAGTGTTLVQQAPAAADAQFWRLLDTGGGTGKIQNVATGQMLGISGALTTPGTAALVSATSGSLGQNWTFTDVTPAFTGDAPPGLTATGAGFSYTFTATAPAGAPAVGFAVTAGALPGGVSLDPVTGVLSGTPAKPGRYTFTVSASTGYATVAGASHTLLVRGVDRVAGDDRYSTAVEISQSGFPDGAKVVFIASGTSFPDALSAGPAAARLGGPVLLTTPDALPGTVAAEISRLGATQVVVVGGTSAVSETVLRDLKKLVPDTERIPGSDRFETSRAVARYAFEKTGASQAVIATGTNFPDALVAGAALGSTGPVILVNGAAPGVDSATAAALTGLHVGTVWIAGGPAAVSAGIQAGLGSIASVTRLAGDDRYATAVAINTRLFPGTADDVLLATGANFPDALAGGAWARRLAGPLYTVPGPCVTDAVLAELTRLEATRITILGGPASVSPSVETLTPCN